MCKKSHLTKLQAFLKFTFIIKQLFHLLFTSYGTLFAINTQSNKLLPTKQIDWVLSITFKEKFTTPSR